MRFTKVLLAAAAVSMTASPVLAAAAQPSVAHVSARAGAKAGNSELAGGGGFFVAIIAVIAVIAGVIIVANQDDEPDSP